MKFQIADREYEFDGEYTLAEAMLFYDKAGIGMAELQQALLRGNPYVTVTLMYILKKRAGEAVRWEDMKHFALTDFQAVPEDLPADPESGDVPAGAAPDPTEESGTSPEPDTGTTS